MNNLIKYSSELKTLNEVEKLVDEITSEFKISTEVYGKVQVSLIEAVNNAILHGNKLDSDKEVELFYEVENSKLKFIITDYGDGFDFSDVPDPTTPENIEKPHGRGIFLMRHLADEIDFRKDGTEVELIFNI
jgi:serine/threonine-protein kinase RsbW